MRIRVSIFFCLALVLGGLAPAFIIDLYLQHGLTVVDYIFMSVGLGALQGLGIYSFTRNN